jgi:hypothetical protein
MANVFHWRIKAGTDLTDANILSEIALKLDDMYTNVSGGMSNQISFADINVFNVTKNAPLGVIPWPTLTAGGSGSTMLPSTVAAFIRATTGISRNWAKKFIGGFTEDDNVSGGLVNSVLMTALGAFGTDWLANITGTGTNEYEPVVHHTKDGVWRLITDIVLTNIWSQVRKRRSGRGS